jgi:hypothetical protein
MRKIIIPCLVLLALVTGCSTPASRIDSHRAAFEKFPAEVQEKIKAGRVDVGFTPEMVHMAMGEPSRQLTRKTESGDVEVWMFADNKPQISFGFGLSSGGYHSGSAVGISTSTGGYEADEKARVEFRNGVVESVEYRKN